MEKYGFKHVHNCTQEATICGHVLYNDVCTASYVLPSSLFFIVYLMFNGNIPWLHHSHIYVQCNTAPCVIMVY